jgi:hypothetical protein
MSLSLHGEGLKTIFEHNTKNPNFGNSRDKSTPWYGTMMVLYIYLDFAKKSVDKSNKYRFVSFTPIDVDVNTSKVLSITEQMMNR